MKKIFYCLSLVCFSVALPAQTFQKPANLPPYTPGQLPSTQQSPNLKLKELADLSITCSGVTFNAGTSPTPLGDSYGFEARVTISVTNNGGIASQPGALRGFGLIPNSPRSTWATPLFTNLNPAPSPTSAGGWNILTSDCDNAIDAIEPGATIEYECTFDVISDFVVYVVNAKTNHIFFTVAIDYDKTTTESNEGNNVAAPIRLSHK